MIVCYWSCFLFVFGVGAAVPMPLFMCYFQLFICLYMFVSLLVAVVEYSHFLINIIAEPPQAWYPTVSRAPFVFYHFVASCCCKTRGSGSEGVVVVILYSIMFLILAAVFPLDAFKT